MEKQIGLKETFNPFLKVLHPETPGTKPMKQLHSELSVFFKYALKEHRRMEEERQSQGLEAKPMSCTIAANIALKVAKKHGLFKLASKLYKLFLTAAPAVVKNEKSFSLLKIVKIYLRNKTSGKRLNNCMILAAEKNITDVFDVTAIAKKWSILKNRRLVIA
ncbi:52 kDa repressor of the inhibitor of the kinase-like [Paramuricea clavata]|uniref:52 kDa repressor of the inhibitor of the kinase-like n=1 Tax=Paramuricea clavata TaxID=317549 RepID=A0A6S7J763_PARCT|nr:52 kDa repressor of the inhibitor of the kinase-like [Paramuricea clavata]